MANVRFYRLGGDPVDTEITEKMTVRAALKKSGIKYQEGDEIRVQNSKVDLDTMITPDQAQFVTAIPKVRGG